VPLKVGVTDVAAPVITGITVLYPESRAYKHPGEAATVVVNAMDADSQQITVTVTVADQAGNEATQNVTVVQSDPLTYSAATAAGHTVTSGANPNEFLVT